MAISPSKRCLSLDLLVQIHAPAIEEAYTANIPSSAYTVSTVISELCKENVQLEANLKRSVQLAWTGQLTKSGGPELAYLQCFRSLSRPLRSDETPADFWVAVKCNIWAWRTLVVAIAHRGGLIKRVNRTLAEDKVLFAKLCAIKRLPVSALKTKSAVLAPLVRFQSELETMMGL